MFYESSFLITSYHLEKESVVLPLIVVLMPGPDPVLYVMLVRSPRVLVVVPAVVVWTVATTIPQK